MNQKIILPDKKKDQQVRGQPIEFHIRNPRKRKYLFIDRKQISSHLGQEQGGQGKEEQERGITKEDKETVGSDVYVHCVDCGGQFRGFIHMLFYEIVYFEYVNLTVYQL